MIRNRLTKQVAPTYRLPRRARGNVGVIDDQARIDRQFQRLITLSEQLPLDDPRRDVT
ncbi:hypothetical protein [Sphingomonas sp.]|uniref:hypothetical protein n=1 Tax=Sphingomonas sp. TaxID=28214 RepID=UPI003AFFD652